MDLIVRPRIYGSVDRLGKEWPYQFGRFSKVLELGVGNILSKQGLVFDICSSLQRVQKQQLHISKLRLAKIDFLRLKGKKI